MKNGFKFVVIAALALTGLEAWALEPIMKYNDSGYSVGDAQKLATDGSEKGKAFAQSLVAITGEQYLGNLFSRVTLEEVSLPLQGKSAYQNSGWDAKGKKIEKISSTQSWNGFAGIYTSPNGKKIVLFKGNCLNPLGEELPLPTKAAAAPPLAAPQVVQPPAPQQAAVIPPPAPTPQGLTFQEQMILILLSRDRQSAPAPQVPQQEQVVYVVGGNGQQQYRQPYSQQASYEVPMTYGSPYDYGYQQQYRPSIWPTVISGGAQVLGSWLGRTQYRSESCIGNNACGSTSSVYSPTNTYAPVNTYAPTNTWTYAPTNTTNTYPQPISRIPPVRSGGPVGAPGNGLTGGPVGITGNGGGWGNPGGIGGNGGPAGAPGNGTCYRYASAGCY
ncbi:MAG: hypothetical protein WCK91_00090 [bacterium]